jgi:hypothetical protein
LFGDRCEGGADSCPRLPRVSLSNTRSKGSHVLVEICFCPDRRGACQGSLFVPSHANPADARGVIHDDPSRQRMRTSWIQGAKRRLSLVWDRPLPERVLRSVPRRFALERLSSRLLAGTLGSLSRHAVSRPTAGWWLEIALSWTKSNRAELADFRRRLRTASHIKLYAGKKTAFRDGGLRELWGRAPDARRPFVAV